MISDAANTAGPFKLALCFGCCASELLACERWQVAGAQPHAQAPRSLPARCAASSSTSATDPSAQPATLRRARLVLHLLVAFYSVIRRGGLWSMSHSHAALLPSACTMPNPLHAALLSAKQAPALTCRGWQPSHWRPRSAPVTSRKNDDVVQVQYCSSFPVTSKTTSFLCFSLCFLFALA